MKWLERLEQLILHGERNRNRRRSHQAPHTHKLYIQYTYREEWPCKGKGDEGTEARSAVQKRMLGGRRFRIASPSSRSVWDIHPLKYVYRCRASIVAIVSLTLLFLPFAGWARSLPGSCFGLSWLIWCFFTKAFCWNALGFNVEAVSTQAQTLSP